MKLLKFTFVLVLIVFFSINGYSQQEKKEYTDAQARLMAKEAAIADAYRSLSRIIYGLTIESETVVKNFITEHDEIRLKLDPFIRGAKVTDVRYLDDGGCDVDLELSIEELEKLLGKKVRYDVPFINVMGSGAPPTSDEEKQEALSSLEIPEDNEWCNKTIRVEGQGVIPDKDEVKNRAQARLMATEAAKAVAYRNLAREVYGIQVASSTYVRDFITKSDKIKTNVGAFIKGARVVETKYDGETATMILELKLNFLGEIIY